ncbi:MAG TPA: ABC transporter ATP-binding protein [Candidatus Saccharibacteria bacterium]|nr:ABC transporter ATP-binding protein [Candidatus Saccharibacteria bacterium]
MIRLFKYLKPYIWLIVPLVILTYLQVMANLQLPDYMAHIVNDGIIGEDMDAIYRNGGIMLLITLGGGIAAVGVGYLAARVATGFARDIRQKVFEKVESFSITEFNTFSTASLITRSTNDIQQIQMVTIMIFRMVLMAPFMAVGALQNAMRNAPELSWIIAVAVVALLAVIVFLFIFALPKFKILQKTVDKLNLVTRENLTGLRVVRAFNNEKVEEKKFDATNNDLMRLNLFVNRLMIILQPFMMLLMNIALVAIVWFGAQLVSDGSVEIGNMMAFMQYATQVIMSFLMISIIFIMVPRASVSAKRVGEVIDTEPTIRDPKKPVKLAKSGRGQIEFRDVTFTYPDADSPVLSGINFTAEPGQTTAFIGSTGSGKSTLIGLIPRFYDVSAGQVLLDGIDVRDLRLKDLYSQVGYVPQKGVLFSGTVKSNITYGNEKASTRDIDKVIKTAQASEFVKKLASGIDSDIAQGGANVSGGQKQRLSIARALAVKPNVYIFDDSFSALDFKTDAALRKALETETRNKTVLIVGQRISTIVNADKIIVLDEGKIVGQGTHSQLMRSNKVYKEIAYSQLSDEELANIEATGKETK